MAQRKKTGIALSEEHIAICDTCRQRFHLGSRNDFVEEAIQYYQDFLITRTQVSRLSENVIHALDRRLEGYTGTVINNQVSMLHDLGEILWLLRQKKD